MIQHTKCSITPHTNKDCQLEIKAASIYPLETHSKFEVQGRFIVSTSYEGLKLMWLFVFVKRSCWTFFNVLSRCACRVHMYIRHACVTSCVCACFYMQACVKYHTIPCTQIYKCTRACKVAVWTSVSDIPRASLGATSRARGKQVSSKTMCI